MPLYVVVFTEQGGDRCQCRIWAATVADHIAVAVKKIWGAHASWTWMPGSDTEGRVYERVGDREAPDDLPRTGLTTVQITPAQRCPRVS
jgi:hypothetical protein